MRASVRTRRVHELETRRGVARGGGGLVPRAGGRPGVRRDGARGDPEPRAAARARRFARAESGMGAAPASAQGKDDRGRAVAGGRDRPRRAAERRGRRGIRPPRRSAVAHVQGRDGPARGGGHDDRPAAWPRDGGPRDGERPRPGRRPRRRSPGTAPSRSVCRGPAASPTGRSSRSRARTGSPGTRSPTARPTRRSGCTAPSTRSARSSRWPLRTARRIPMHRAS